MFASYSVVRLSVFTGDYLGLGRPPRWTIQISENDFEKDIEKLVWNVEKILVVENVLDNILD